MEISIKYNTPISPEPPIVQEGYTFSGWSEIPQFMPACDVLITSSLTANPHLLTYIVDGILFKNEIVNYGTKLIPIDEPLKEGYTFSGWGEIPETMPDNDITITGTFSINTYKLTYMIDGMVYMSSYVTYGDAIFPMTPPTKEGKTFSGWSEIPETMPAHDVIVTGSFETDGINFIKTNRVINIYNLQGVQVKETKENLPAGIYIQDGKKFIVK